MNEFELKQQAHLQEQMKWVEYFRNDSNIGLAFISDMESALKAGFIDDTDAELCLTALSVKIRELQPLIDRIKRNRTSQSIKNWKG